MYRIERAWQTFTDTVKICLCLVAYGFAAKLAWQVLTHSTGGS